MPKEVLFVDDDDDVREFYALMLRAAGFTVVEMRRASDALETIARRSFDVILLDMFMPSGEMSGTELLVRLREHPESAEVPVVVLSEFGDVLNPDLMARLGVRAVLLKSQARHTDVVQAIRDALGSRRSFRDPR